VTQQLGPGFITQTQTTYAISEAIVCYLGRGPNVARFLDATSVVVRARLSKELAPYVRVIKWKRARIQLPLSLRGACATARRSYVHLRASCQRLTALFVCFSRAKTFSGESWEHPDYLPGDLIFKIKTADHPRFVRKGDDLHMNITISLLQALVGFRKTFKHLDGHVVTIARAEVTKPGKCACRSVALQAAVPFLLEVNRLRLDCQG